MIRKILLTLCLLLSLTSPLQAQVAYVTGGGDTSSVEASLDTAPFTVGSETNRVLIAVVHWNTPIGETLSGVTWDLASPENFTACAAAFTSGNNNIQIWYLVNPTAGTDTVTATWSGATIGSQGIFAALFSGANQSTPCTDFTTATGTSLEPALAAISAAVDDDYLIDVVFSDASEPGEDADQTLRFTEGGHGFSTQDGNASDDIMSWTLASSQLWVMGAVRVAAAGAGGTPARMLLLGVGGF